MHRRSSGTHSPREGIAIHASTTPHASSPSGAGRRVTIVLGGMLIALSLVITAPAPVRASTATNMAAQIVKLMNADRAARGLRVYRTWTALVDLATDRAGSMAARNTLSHTAAGGNVGTALSRRGIQWYTYGEAIGSTGYPYGSQAAANLYSMWKGSSPHRALLLSANFNYVGVGIGYRSSTRTTYASIVFSESVDHTGAAASNRSLGVKGNDITFTWSGYDPLLQTRTAGLRSFDVQYRINGGTWRTIRNDTTATTLMLADRAPGTYGFRVQAADRRGTLGRWTSETRVTVP